jgi:pimeloyl-[acyl-carrier protein] methyl ester esterase
MRSLFTEVNGEGAPLVLLHGWGLNVRVWDSIVPRLATRFKVITIDLPGHGRSTWHESARTLSGYAQLVAETCRSITDRTISLLGWSLGGQIALELTASGFDVSTLTLVATTPKFAASADWPYGMNQQTLEGFAKHFETDYRQTVSDFLDLQARGSANSDAVLKALKRALFEHGEAQPEALRTGLQILETFDLRPKLSAIHQPTLVIAGQYDRVTSPAAARALSELLPHAKYLEIRRAGHAPFLSHPDIFLDALA